MHNNKMMHCSTPDAAQPDPLYDQVLLLLSMQLFLVGDFLILLTVTLSACLVVLLTACVLALE